MNRLHGPSRSIAQILIGGIVLTAAAGGAAVLQARPQAAQAAATPTAAAGLTGTATPPPATPTPAPTASSTPTAPPPAPGATFEIAGRLVEDLNGNGAADSDDNWAPAPTLLELIPWKTLLPVGWDGSAPQPVAPRTAGVDIALDMFSADDGSFRFTNVPPGDYSLWIWWVGGFVNGGADRLPDLYRAAVRIQTDGSMAAPSPLPTTWPESFGSERFDPTADRTSIGAVPSVILLKKKPKNMIPYPVSSGTAAITARGVLDVGAVLAQRASRVALPSAGQGAAESATQMDRTAGERWLPAVAIAALALGAGVVLVRARRRE